MKLIDRIQSGYRTFNKIRGNKIIRNTNFRQGFKNLLQREENIDDKGRMYSTFANEAYQDGKRDVGDYKYLDSDNGVSAYKKGDDIIFSYRGTDNVRDVFTDADLATGNLRNTDRYRDNKGFVERIVRDNEGSSFKHVGHSLGGTLAKNIGKDFNHASIGFNSGSTPLEKSVSNPLHHEYRTKKDPISFTNTDREKTTFVRQKGKDPHGISNFL